jgi:hypothetical protein
MSDYYTNYVNDNCDPDEDFDDGDDAPACQDCGTDLDPNGFCDECDGDPWD